MAWNGFGGYPTRNTASVKAEMSPAVNQIARDWTISGRLRFPEPMRLYRANMDILTALDELLEVKWLWRVGGVPVGYKVDEHVDPFVLAMISLTRRCSIMEYIP